MSFDDIDLDRRELLFTTAGTFGALGFAGNVSAGETVEVNVDQTSGRSVTRRTTR